MTTTKTDLHDEVPQWLKLLGEFLGIGSGALAVVNGVFAIGLAFTGSWARAAISLGIALVCFVSWFAWRWVDARIP